MQEAEAAVENNSPFEEEIGRIEALFAPIKTLQDEMTARFDPAADLLDAFRGKYVWGTGEGKEVQNRKIQLLNATLPFLGERPLDEGSSYDSLKQDFPKLEELETVFNEFDPTLLPYFRNEIIRMTTLCEEIRPALVQEVQQLGERIRSRTNYERVFRDSFQDRPSAAYDFLLATSPPSLDDDDKAWDIFWRHQRWFDELKDLAKTTKQEENHWLDETPELPDDLSNHQEVVGSAHEVSDQIWEYNRLYQTYKVWALGSGGDVDISESVGLRMAMHFSKRSGGVEPLLVENDYALHALSQLFAQEIQQWRKDGIIRRVEGEIPSSEQVIYGKLPLEVDGLVKRDDMSLFLLPEDVEARLVGMKKWTEVFPGWFIEGIEAIEFINPPDWESREIFSEDVLSFFYEFIYLKSQVLETMFHEIFEHVVTKISLDEMEAFEVALATDHEENGAEHISWYVKRTALEKDSKYRRALSKKEDFCETAAMFTINPYQLFQTAPARYEFMLIFFAQHLPGAVQEEYVKQHRDFIRKLEAGTTEEMNGVIKDNTLAHQKQDEEEVLKAKTRTVGRYQPSSEEPKERKGKVIKVESPVYLTISSPSEGGES